MYTAEMVEQLVHRLMKILIDKNIKYNQSRHGSSLAL
jgi:hypothetical protein